ncbi:MAG: hypothetical protein AABX10_01620 [Nanoarchaeota archaeon]
MLYSISFRGRKILVDLKKTGFFRKGLGLTFRTRNTDNLLFEFNKEVSWQGTLTSIFVFFPFLTLWLDNKNKVIDYKVVRPFVFSISQKKRFYRIVEIPINKANFSLISKFVNTAELKKYYRR